ncbi:hypothetical protein ES703_45802 [subsurface metagenome]
MKKYYVAAESMVYECVKCGKRARSDEWSYPGTNTFKCPKCGYRVAKKLRNPVVKRVNCR